jgi:hypothetical protein
MTAKQPLQGIILIDCAKANAKQGLKAAAEQCGYGDNTDAFLQEVTHACQEAGIYFKELSDLTDMPQNALETGVEIAPDTPSEL